MILAAYIISPFLLENFAETFRNSPTRPEEYEGGRMTGKLEGPLRNAPLTTISSPYQTDLSVKRATSLYKETCPQDMLENQTTR